MNKENIKKAVQVVEVAKAKAEAAELTARQVKSKIEEESAKAVRTLRLVIDRAEQALSKSGSTEEARRIRDLIENMSALKHAVTDFGLATDFGLVAHRLGVLQEDLGATSQALQRITPQD